MKPSKQKPDIRRCGLCGKTTKLTKTECCGQWICDDEDQYVLFSYARNSCYRNHDHYTLCSYHHNEGHAGHWKDCKKCRDAFETEQYVWLGTNEYNFEKLENPPKYDPKHCSKCGKVIKLGTDGYSQQGDVYTCYTCFEKETRKRNERRTSASTKRETRGGFHAGEAEGESDRRNGMGANRKRSTIPQNIRPIFDEVVLLTDEVCGRHLNDEYGALCRKLAGVLARKRPSPLASGRPKTWACGIAYALGVVNFLFDPTQTPHLRAADLCGLFDVSPSSGSAKSRQIMDLLKIIPLDPRWCIPSFLAKNPLAWMIEVDGLIVDARQLPRELQEEAHRLGLIPFVPGSTT